MKLVLLFGVLWMGVLCHSVFGQNWQDLSHSGVDIQSFNFNQQPDDYYKRTTSTTPVPSTTTKKSGGFFSGFKKIFGGGKSTEAPVSSTTAAPTRSTTRPTQKTTVKSRIDVPAATSTTAKPTISTSTQSSSTRQGIAVTPSSTVVSQLPSSTVSTTTTTTTVRSVPKSVSVTTPRTTTAKDEWPALPPAGGNSNNKKTKGSTTPSAVQFLPGSTTPRSVSRSTTKKPSSGPVTDAELATLSEALFTKDTNNAYRYVTPNYQGRTQSSVGDDAAPEKLLTIDERHIFALPTVEKFRALFNNYEQDAAVNEYITPNERKEENDFIDAVMATSVMRHALNFLQQKGIFGPDPAKQREELKAIWFNMYSRGGGKIGSSGFEHVFVSEVKNGSLSGLHNWLYYYDEEKAGRIDYKGYMKKLTLGNKADIAKVRMCVYVKDQICKPTNSLFIGTSPELEMALYTVCFELRPDQECPMTFNGKTFNIKTHTFRYRGKNLIGSAFVEI
ncbi:endoribonuclease CG2145 [Culicoides brevitarsis]|uniref:endoribonuclease CG2145 n=1 Tax=Culicoides brevitarsis TaxID=469753 RepID=UPI00307C025F